MKIIPAVSTDPVEPHARASRGSALIMAIFVLALLGSVGLALLFLTSGEIEMSRSSLRVKESFYLAEAAIEDARAVLVAGNTTGDFDGELDVAAGLNDAMDFDSNTLQPIYTNGKPTGFAGAGDDEPLRPLTAFGLPPSEGWYAAFLTNDPGDPDPLADTDERVVITGVGLGRDRSMEIVQAVIASVRSLPAPPPAALMLWGDSPDFQSGSSSTSAMTGDDCGGTGVPNLNVPIVGTIGDAAEAAAEAGYYDNNNSNGPSLTSGPYTTQQDTFANMLDPGNEPTLPGGYSIDPAWLDCQSMKDMIEAMRPVADYLCEPPASCSVPAPGTLTPSSLIFIDDDVSVSGPGYLGTLVVTGTLDIHGDTDWTGVILAVGEGSISRSGGGSGVLSGSVLVANIAGQDGVYGTADDCCMNPPACDTPPDGFGQSHYTVSGGGNANIQYCLDATSLSNPVRAYRVTDFIQR